MRFYLSCHSDRSGCVGHLIGILCCHWLDRIGHMTVVVVVLVGCWVIEVL